MHTKSTEDHLDEIKTTPLTNEVFKDFLKWDSVCAKDKLIVFGVQKNDLSITDQILEVDIYNLEVQEIAGINIEQTIDKSWSFIHDSDKCYVLVSGGVATENKYMSKRNFVYSIDSQEIDEEEKHNRLIEVASFRTPRSHHSIVQYGTK